MHNTENASWDRRHVIMVYAIIRIMHAFDFHIQIRIMDVRISTSFIISKLHAALKQQACLNKFKCRPIG